MSRSSDGSSEDRLSQQQDASQQKENGDEAEGCVIRND